jgi:hypothetical protein
VRCLFVVALALAGCKPKPPASPQCVQDLQLQFQRIDDYHAKLKQGEKPPAATYWSRFYLETARYVLTGRGGIDAGRTCTGADRESGDADRLRAAFAERERVVLWIEQQRGVKFEGVLRTGPAWRWVNSRDGKLIDRQTAGSL